MRVTVRQRPDRDNLQLAATDPMTGKTITRSAGTKDWRAAERAAAAWEAELKQNHGLEPTAWEFFRQRFENEHLITLSDATQRNYHYGLNKFERLMGKARDVRSITASVVSQYAQRLRKNLKSEASVATNLMVLRSVLNWGASVGIIQAAPKIRASTIQRRGKPITICQFIRFVQRLKKLQDGESLQRIAMIMWLGGLRLGEAMKLHCSSPPVRIDLSGRRPAIAWSIGGQKSGRVERTPITPDFARYLSRFKSGSVADCRLAKKTVTTRIQSVGEGITSHDLRRSFGNRWALRVHPLVLKALMRHRSLETTLRYYVDLDIDDVADKVWEIGRANKTSEHTCG